MLPEFCNHLSWYTDMACYGVSIDLDGAFTKAIASKAKKHGLYIVLNATARREMAPQRHQYLISPTGSVVATSDKQVLIGHENDFTKRRRVLPHRRNTHWQARYVCLYGRRHQRDTT